MHSSRKHNSIIRRVLLILLFLGMSCSQVFSYIVNYKEEYYKLFHQHYQQYPENIIENIYWLERAVAADFCNPRYALAKITTEDEWEKYRYLFNMHVNLKLAEQHLRLGRIYDKQQVYFYDAPLKDQFLEDLEQAKSCYEMGIAYWNEAKNWAELANQKKFNFLFITDQQAWEDERERIYQGSLDYEKTINRELARVQSMCDTLNQMDENTY